MPKTAQGWIAAGLVTAVIVAVIFRVPQVRSIVVGQ
jgi:hypothetical protein